MRDYSGHDLDGSAARRHIASEGEYGHGNGGETASALSPSQACSLMREASIGEQGNSAVRAGALQTMQQTHGNRAVQRSIQANSRPASVGRVSVQRSALGAIPTAMDQARRAADAAAATNKPKEDQSGGWPELPDWLTPDGIGKAGSDLLNGIFGGAGGPGSASPTDEGWIEGL